jgi:chromosomal replication initiator protein
VDGLCTIPFSALRAASPPLSCGGQPGTAGQLGSHLFPSNARPRPPVFHDFLAGPENQLVVAAILTVIHRGPRGCNPFVLYGPPGSGKSILAAGLAELSRQHDPMPRVIKTTAIDFARAFHDAMDTFATDEFSNRLRQADLLVVEDLQHLATWPLAQAELAHAIDALLDHDRQVIATMSHAPRAECGLARRLRSRLASGLAIPVSLPGPATRIEVLRLDASRRGLSLSEDQLHQLAEPAGCFHSLQGRLTALEAQFPVQAGTSPGSRPAQQQRDLASITTIVARFFGLRAADLRGPSRRRNTVLARSLAIYLARELAGDSFAKIGRHFGNRDHSTVIHAWQNVKRFSATDPYVQRCLDELRQAIDRDSRGIPAETSSTPTPYS